MCSHSCCWHWRWVVRKDIPVDRKMGLVEVATGRVSCVPLLTAQRSYDSRHTHGLGGDVGM